MMTIEERRQFVRSTSMCNTSAAENNLLALVLDLYEKIELLEKRLELLDNRTISSQRIGLD